MSARLVVERLEYFPGRRHRLPNPTTDLTVRANLVRTLTLAVDYAGTKRQPAMLGTGVPKRGMPGWAMVGSEEGHRSEAPHWKVVSCLGALLVVLQWQDAAFERGATASKASNGEA